VSPSDGHRHLSVGSIWYVIQTQGAEPRASPSCFAAMKRMWSGSEQGSLTPVACLRTTLLPCWKRNNSGNSE
ncbi:hypothetical protein LEMLEM_LOCUS15125, partial [Lemmus lemmus]